MSVLLPDVRRMPSGGRGLSNVLPSTEFGYPSPDGRPNSLVRGCPLIPHKRLASKDAALLWAIRQPEKGAIRMSELLFFIIGVTLGSLSGVMLMCCLQINRLSDREVKKSEKPKGTDTFPFD